MDELEAGLRRDEAVRFLLPLFFVSGATGLVWQTVWARDLELVFGTSTFAIATVLSAFMAGLAAGGFAAGALADRAKNPVMVYGALEIGIGGYALAFPHIVKALTPVYLHVARMIGPYPVDFGIAQALLVGSALLIPTALMGATLPLLARFATDRLGSAGDRVSRLYAINTAGAIAGTAICGFAMLPLLGKDVTTYVAAGANIALGLAAFGVAGWSEGAETARMEVDVPVEPVGDGMLRVAIAMGLGGFASLVYEVAWTRVLALMLGASVYAFSVMLLAFLTGIAIGGRAGGPLADAIDRRWGARGVILALAGIELAIGASAWGLLWLFPALPMAYVWLFDGFDAAEWPGIVYVVSLIVAGLVMTPPAVLMGLAFPVAVRAVVGENPSLAVPVGRIYGANTLGAVFGAALAGFVLLPNLWVVATVSLAAGVNLLAGAVLLLDRAPEADPRARRGMLGVAGVCAVLFSGVIVRPWWNQLWMTSGMYKYVTDLSDHSIGNVWEASVSKFELLYYAEGLSSVVTVAQNKQTGNIWLANNGKIDASTSGDMPTQVLVALIPFQYVEHPDDVMLIGLASGITAGAVATVPDVKRLDVVELEPAILDAARVFDEYNHHVLDDPRVNVIANDGRNQVLLSAPGSYDLVISEPSNPWLTGVSNLFTRDFLLIGRSRLKKGGVWAQWVQMYGMGTEDLKSLLATFASVYPHVLVFTTIEDADLVIVGSDSPIEAGPAAAARLLGLGERTTTALREVDVHTDVDLMTMFLMDQEGIGRFAKGEPLNTDDNLRIEYSAPLHLHATTSESNMEKLLLHAQVPVAGVHDDPVLLLDLARGYLKRDDFERSMDAAIEAAKVSAAQDPDPDARVYAARALDSEQDGFRGAIAALEKVTDAATRRPDPPDAYIEAFWAWQADLSAWAKN